MNDAPWMNETAWRGKLYLNGWKPGAAGSFDVTDKATGEPLSRLGLATPEDVAEAARIAREMQPKWYGMPYDDRARIFRRAAVLIEDNMDELATWIMRETGAIGPKADVELKMAAGILNASANMPTEAQGLLLPSNQGRISLARRLPHGVVGVIAPFNFPLILAIRAVSPALATGNTVVLKPDPQTAAAGGALIARLFEEAGLPEGALHVLPGGAEVGQAICTDSNIAMVAFTGSTAAGRRVGELCGKHLKKVSLELGGKNSLIVLDDADPGAKLSAGGTFDKLFYKPTVIDNVKPGMRAFEEEIFGPVASVTSFSTDDEAIRLANQTEYGLSAAVISRSIGRAMAIGNRLYTGLLHINDQTVHDEPHIPFGGRGASGNGGRIGGPANWEEFTQWQWVTIKDSPLRYPF